MVLERFVRVPCSVLTSLRSAPWERGWTEKEGGGGFSTGLENCGILGGIIEARLGQAGYFGGGTRNTEHEHTSFKLSDGVAGEGVAGGGEVLEEGEGAGADGFVGIS